MILFPLLISAALAESIDLRNLKEKTYTRDNTYCKFGPKRVEFQIRSESKFSDRREKAYGEYVVFYPEEENMELLKLNKDMLHTFRLFYGKSDLCSKTYGFKIGKDKTAILFLQENRPFKDKLIIQLLNSSGTVAQDTIHTQYISDQAEAYPDGFIFRIHSERLDIEMGKIKMKDIDYTYQDREFISWMSYTSEGFKHLPTQTYFKFSWKHLFKDEQDFLTSSGWTESSGTFANQKLFMAVNLKLKKECVLMLPEKMNITGTEPGWRCN